MRIERGRDGDDETNVESHGRAGACDCDKESDRAMESDHARDAVGVHVRRLDAMDTLRWSWEVLGHRRELLGVAFAATLPSVVAAAGVSPPSATASREFAAWVWPAYALHFVALAVAGGTFYLTAANAVANRSEPLADRLVAAARRFPALVGTGIVTVLLVILGLLSAILLAVVAWPPVWVGLPLTLLVTTFTVYVFVRLLLAYPACVIDGTDPVDSTRSGWLAATGTVRKVFAVGVVYVLASGASGVVAGFFGRRYDVGSTLASAVLGSVLLPLFGLALAHLYLEGSRNR